MKKIKFSPLQMDQKTIAKLDREQLEKIRGGITEDPVTPGTTNCTKNSCKHGTSCNGSSLGLED